MKIGEKIKQLRTQRGITQETLANHLGISFQAVSKWENGTALPDITLVPALSAYFGVSADELLGLRDDVDEAELAEYTTQYWQLIGKNRKEATELCRKVLEKYPRNYQWMRDLAFCLMPSDTDDKENWSKVDFDEGLALCERILDECADNRIRDWTRWMLCKRYGDAGKREKAIELAKKMPSLWQTQEWLLEMALDGEERIVQWQQNLDTAIDWCTSILSSLSDNSYTNYSWQDKIHCYEAQIALMNILYQGEENSLFANHIYMSRYVEMARMCAGSKGMEYFNASKTMEYLLKAEAAARRYDDWYYSVRKPYKSIFLNKSEYVHGDVPEKGEVGMMMVPILHMRIKSEPCFDSMKNVPEFTALMARLVVSE